MEVTFRTTHLEECFRLGAQARRAWGVKVARRYVERVTILQAARSVTELYAMAALHFHPLKGSRAGQYAMSLGDRWRLIVTVRDDAMTMVRVEEVSKHYGD